MNARAHDIIAVTVPNGVAALLIHLIRSVDPHLIIEAIVGAVTVAYTIWRWRKDARGEK